MDTLYQRFPVLSRCLKQLFIKAAIMKPQSQIYVLIIIIMAMLSSNACSDSERRIGLSSQTSTVVLNLNLPDKHAVAHTPILDRIFRFFMREAVAQTAPATFSSVAVLVTGPDIAPIEQNFTSAPTISFDVPAGAIRQFDVTAYVAPWDPSAAASFHGIAVANLPAGTTVSVPVVMLLKETKIVIPDGGLNFSPGGLIMMDSMYPNSSWIYKQVTDYGGLANLEPVDIDFDSRGRIYIANSNSPAIIRMDDINGTNLLQSSATVFGTGTPLANAYTIAVDRIRNLVYFCTQSAPVIYRSNLDGTSTVAFPSLSATISTVTGIDVDNEGMLYVVGYTDTIIRYNPNTRAIIAGPFTTSLTTPADVLYRAPYIYIANRSTTTSGSGVTQLSISNNTFGFIAQYGLYTGSANSNDPYFYGAYRFLAIRNDLIIADSSTFLAKLVSISPDPLGNNWIPFGQHGAPTTTPGNFYLFSSC
jgi:hypothetical protein